MAAQSGQKIFGAGRFYGILATGVATPNPFHVTQDAALDFKRDIKRLHGVNQLPVDVAAGMLTVVGKVTNGVIAARALNDLMIGGTLSTGQIPNIANESLTITTGSTASSLVNGAGLVTDLGIYGSTDGIPLTKVTTGTVASADQYSLTTAGAIQLSSLAARTGLKASYLYSTSGGQQVALTNQPMGKTGGFVAVLAFLWSLDKATVQLNNCIASDYGIATKLDDYTKPVFGFEAAVDATDSLGTFSFAEIS